LSLAQNGTDFEQQWQLLSPSAITWREWGDGLVLYNDATGHTHQLNPLSSEVMLALLRHPAGIATTTLMAEIVARVDTSEIADLSHEINRVLDQLLELRVLCRGPRGISAKAGTP